MAHSVEYKYVSLNGEKFFTVILLPEKEGRFPVAVCRTPYVKHTVNTDEKSLASEQHKVYTTWLERGYAVLFQHCRGQGKSTGAFIPYVCEREDGLAFREWIRKQPFYNGEIFLIGGSYTASLHYATAPFEPDVKGAVFEVQDSNRYRLWYRNGQMRKGHANWHFGLYKDKCGLNKNFNMGSFARLPLKDLSVQVLNDYAADFEEMLCAPLPSDKFWSTRNGGVETADAVTEANIPILLTTGYNDFYVGGVFDMWRRMDAATKSKSALLVSPYNHGDGYDKECGIAFPQGQRSQAFGQYCIDWLDNVRHGTPLPFEKGVITYYRAFEKGWASDFYKTETVPLEAELGKGVRSFNYDPTRPTAFRCEGLTAEENGAEGGLRLCTPAFEEDTFVKGRMKAVLTVSSTASDTSFYMRLSIKKPEYTYVLRHDITSLCYQLGSYVPDSKVKLNFEFDEYAFLIRKGECLQIDIASTDGNTYVCHTNRKGEYHLQTRTDKAKNTVYLDESRLILPTEEKRDCEKS